MSAGCIKCDEPHLVSTQEGCDRTAAPLLSWELYTVSDRFQLQPLVEPQPSQT